MSTRVSNAVAIALLSALACSSGAKNTTDASGVGGALGSGGTSGGGVTGTGGGAGLGGSGGNRTCGTPARRDLRFSSQRVRMLPAGIVPAGIALPASGPPAIIYFGADQAGNSNQIWATTVPQQAGDGGVTTTTGIRLSRGSNSGVATSPASVSRTRDGSVRVAYVEQNLGARVRYVEWSGDVNQNPIDVEADGSNSGNSRPVLSLDASDRPTIVFLDIDSVMHFARRPQGSWQGETVTTGAVLTTGAFTGLDDAAGMPIAFATAQVGGTPGVTASVRTASGWTKQPVDSNETDVGPRAALDPMGRVVVMWGTAEGMGLAVREGDVWSVTSPLRDSDGGVFGGGPSSAFDFTFAADGQIRIVYGDSRVDYAYSDGCFWYHQAVEPEFVQRTAPVFAVDAAGNVHVATFNRSTNELWYEHGAP